jgi:hypothetical protein
MTDKISEIEKLASLHKRGLLSDAEFESEKRRLLHPAVRGPEANSALRSTRLPVIAFALLALIAVAFGVWRFWPASGVDSPPVRSADAVPQPSQTAPVTAAEPASVEYPAVAKTPDAVPEIGNCHIGECSWSKLLEFAAAGKSPLGSLFRLELLGGTSEHDSVDDYPSSFSSRVQIKWDEHPHTVYVFCSEQLPAVMMKTDEGAQVDVLDFTDPTGLPDVLISSANLYSQACHMNGSEWTEPGFAKRFGYSSPARFGDLKLTKPTDILNVR